MVGWLVGILFNSCFNTAWLHHAITLITGPIYTQYYTQQWAIQQNTTKIKEKLVKYNENILRRTNMLKLYLNIGNTALYKITNILSLLQCISKLVLTNL